MLTAELKCPAKFNRNELIENLYVESYHQSCMGSELYWESTVQLLDYFANTVYVTDIQYICTVVYSKYIDYIQYVYSFHKHCDITSPINPLARLTFRPQSLVV